MFSIVTVWNVQTKKYDMTIGLKMHLLGVPANMIGELTDLLCKHWAAGGDAASLFKVADTMPGGFYDGMLYKT
jgi:hypothetical protein